MKSNQQAVYVHQAYLIIRRQTNTHSVNSQTGQLAV